MPIIEDCYLGEAVYVHWDGYRAWLYLRGRDVSSGIALHPQAVEALNAFVAKANTIETNKEPDHANNS